MFPRNPREKEEREERTRDAFSRRKSEVPKLPSWKNSRLENSTLSEISRRGTSLAEILYNRMETGSQSREESPTFQSSSFFARRILLVHEKYIAKKINRRGISLAKVLYSREQTDCQSLAVDNKSLFILAQYLMDRSCSEKGRTKDSNLSASLDRSGRRVLLVHGKSIARKISERYYRIECKRIVSF